MVLDLVQKCALKPGTLVACDRFFGSIELLLTLKAKYGVFGVCTLMSNRIGFPKHIIPEKKESRERGDIKYATSTKSKISVVCWKDSKDVFVAGTVGKVDGSTCKRNLKRQDRKEGGPSKVTLPRPQMIDLYNTNMGGTDVGDRYRNYLDIEGQQKFRKWYKKLFFGIVGCMTVNASIIFGKMVKTDSWRDKGLLLRFATALHERLVAQTKQPKMELKWVKVEEQQEASPATPPTATPTRRVSTRTVAISPIDTLQGSLAEVMNQTNEHVPVAIEGNKQRECVYCKMNVSPNKYKNVDRAPRTTKMCTICIAPLCVGQRNCFFLYHQQQKVSVTPHTQHKGWKREKKCTHAHTHCCWWMQTTRLTDLSAQ